MKNCPLCNTVPERYRYPYQSEIRVRCMCCKGVDTTLEKWERRPLESNLAMGLAAQQQQTEHQKVCHKRDLGIIDKLGKFIRAAYKQEFEEDEQSSVEDLVRHAFVTLAERSKEIRLLKAQKNKDCVRCLEISQ